MTADKIGILLVNLGTPASPKISDIYRYLIEFLTDDRVIDLPWLQRQLLVRGLIVPLRVRQSAKAYQKIWTSEGSPLMVYGKAVQDMLQKQLGSGYIVELGMRYQQPSVSEAVVRLSKHSLSELIVFPLFPHYASATTGSAHQNVMEVLSSLAVIPKTTFIDSYYAHPKFIHAWCERARKYSLSDYDHILFSFHGLPERQILKADCSHHCLKSVDCCKTIQSHNRMCYSAQCLATAQAIAKQLQIPTEKYSYCFQSRLGKEPWLKPYASDTIKQLAESGKKKVLVFSPSFVSDCLETLYEIKEEYLHEFRFAGGEVLELVPSLNDSPEWVQAIQDIIQR